MDNEKPKDLTSIFDLPPSEEVFSTPSSDFEIHQDLSQQSSDDLSPGGSDFSFDLKTTTTTSEPFPPPSADSSPSLLAPSGDSSLSSSPSPPLDESSTLPSEHPIPEHPIPEHPIQAIKQFSESVPIGQARAAPTDPFTVRITGHLEIHEQTKLLDLIRIHDMGFRESDLEPQIQAGRILLPKMSEYAAVLIVQALRGARAEIHVFPENQEQTIATVNQQRPRIETDSNDEPHPAEMIPVTQDSRIPGFKTIRVIDVVTASHSFLTPMVEAGQNSEYDEILQALTRELKYRAYRKKANALLHFRVQLLPLSLDSGHRLVISATAAQIEPQSQ